MGRSVTPPVFIAADSPDAAINSYSCPLILQKPETLVLCHDGYLSRRITSRMHQKRQSPALNGN